MPTTDLSVPVDAGEISTGEGSRRPRLASPSDILAAIPTLLGFRPSPGDLVILGARRDDPAQAARVRIILRYDLPGQPDPAEWRLIGRHAVSALDVNDVEVATAAGYGPDRLVSPVAPVLRQALDGAGMRLAGFLHVQDGRYWSCLGRDPDSCPPEGTAFDEAMASSLPGGRRVLASRDVLAATLAPVTGEDAEPLRAGTSRVLRDLDGQDDALFRMDRQDRETRLKLFTDLTRLARPGHVAAPATLLAFTAWQCGNGALANIALDRALADNPDFESARTMRRTIDRGLSWKRSQQLVPPPELPVGPELFA